MKKIIIGAERDWLVFLSALSGLALILFPEQLSNLIPFFAGIGLVLNGLASGFVCWRYHDAGAKPGRAVLFLALGISILLNSSEAIGVIGAIWAMISLNEAAEEINEAAENKHFAPLQAVMTVISIALAVMLLFDPFEHFVTHVRILGLEMIASVFIRRRNILRGK